MNKKKYMNKAFKKDSNKIFFIFITLNLSSGLKQTEIIIGKILNLTLGMRKN